MAKGNSKGIVTRLKFKQSAAKCPRNRVKVQRIGYGVLAGRAEDGKTQERRTLRRYLKYR